MMGQFDRYGRKSVVACWCGATALTIILSFLCFFVGGPQHQAVHGFSFIMHRQGRIMDQAIMTTSSKATTNPRQPQRRKQHQVLFGLMEDMMNEQQEQAEEEEEATGASETTSENDNNNQKHHEELFESIIFCSTGDIQKEIQLKLDECSQPGFLQYLLTSMESSNDLEEKEGLQELLNWIQQAIATKEEEEEEELAQQQQQQIQIEVNDETDNDTEADADVDGSKLSNTEVLKRANVIDQATAQLSELSDDEKQSDFMSDCREVVNLSRGFNDRGQMRVGG